MEKIKCPVCQSDVDIDTTKAVDENGEVYRCSKCENLILE